MTRRATTVVGFLSVLLTASLALASEHGGGHEGAHHIDWYYLGGQIFTFFVFVIGLFVAGKKPITEFFAGRHTAVKAAVEEAQRAKQDALAKAAAYEQKMKDIDSEMKALADSFKASAAAEKQRLIEDAEAAAKRISKEAEAVISTELEKAQTKLRQDTADLALQLAEEILRRELKTEDQKRLVSEFTSRLATGTAKQEAA
jgi:F-type H+-transporting ATPase subunit b